MSDFSLTTLKEILRDCAGEGDGMSPDGDVRDIPFAELGYDSIALLETAGKIQQLYGVQLADDAVTEARTPDDFLTLVNNAMSGR